MSGKGSAPRPMPDYEKYSDNYDLIFRKKKNEPVQDSSSTERTLAQVGECREGGEKTLPQA
ncbi:MAG: hypothetical protein ACO222_07725 [Polynucleobacter sp.]